MADMGNVIAILEDDAARIAEMRACLSEALPSLNVIVFDHAANMIQWLGEHLNEIRLISLDHDLPLTRFDGKLIDFGTGRQVVDYLATLPPVCSIIVHSSNGQYAPGMCFALKDAGWQYHRVYPLDDLAWIKRDWLKSVQELAI